MVKNLTNGKPLKLLFFFALPMVLGNLFQQLYNMVDSMVVGKFVGEDADRYSGHDAQYELFQCNVELYGAEYWSRQGKTGDTGV